MALYKKWPQPGNINKNVPKEATERVLPDKPPSVPFIFWGGDVAPFHANGDFETLYKPGSTTITATVTTWTQGTGSGVDWNENSRRQEMAF